MYRSSFNNFKGRTAWLLLALLICAGCMLPCFASSADTSRGNADALPAEGEKAGLPIDNNPSYLLDYSTIRVKITISKDINVSEIQLKLLGEYYFTDLMQCISDTTDSEYTLRIVNSGGVVYAYNSSGTLLTRGSSLRLNKVLKSSDAGYATLFTEGCVSNVYPYGTNGNHYQGDFVFDVDEDGLLRMVNIVPMEYYIYGVIEHEISYLCKPAALRAQAIAAKCFGMSFMYQKEYFDVTDGYTGYYQMYRGFQLDTGKQTLLPHCAYVIGEAISYSGKIIPTYYGATNGGETTIPSIAFNSVDAGYDSAYGINIDDADFAISTSATYLSTIEVTYGAQKANDRDFTGRFKDFILAKARATLGGSYNKVLEINYLNAFDPLPGTRRNMRQVSFSAVVIDTDYTPDPDDPDDPGPQSVTITCTFPASELKSVKLSDYDGSGNTYPSNQSGVFYTNNLKYWGESTSNGYKLYYCGFGHALGLSQKGAEAWALPEYGGKTYRQILQFYYPNFNFVNITEEDPEAPFACSLVTAAYGRCTGANVNVRTAPTTSGSTILGIAHTDDHLDIVSVTADGEWYLVMWNGHMGYMNYKFVLIDMFPSPANALFTLYTARGLTGAVLRTAPTAYANSTMSLSGINMTVWASVGGWYYVVTDSGCAGYVLKNSVTVTDEYEYNGAASIPSGAPRPQYLSSADERPTDPIRPGKIRG